MSTTIQYGPYTSVQPTNGDASDVGGAQAGETAAAPQVPSANDVASILGNLQNLTHAPAYGINAYGSTQSHAVNTTAGLGQAVMPASSMQPANPADLATVQGLMNSYGQGGLTGTSGIVGNSLLWAAESGNLPDLNGLQSAQKMERAPTDDEVAAAQKTSSSSDDSGNDTNTVSGRQVTTSTADNGKFAEEIRTNADNHDKKKCHKLEKGEEANAQLFMKLGIKDEATANKLAQMLNPTNKDRGVSGAPATNIVNLLAVLEKLQSSGQGKSEANKQATDQLLAIVKDADAHDGVLSTTFIGDTNVAASFVTQFALNPSLTSFSKPTVDTAAPARPALWPEDVTIERDDDANQNKA